jgi:hypothetical protein
MGDRAEFTDMASEIVERELVETPGRRLRVAVLIRALIDVEIGGRLRTEALEWLLDESPRGEGLRARDLFEELGLDPDLCQRALRRGGGRTSLRRIAEAAALLPSFDFPAAAVA